MCGGEYVKRFKQPIMLIIILLLVAINGFIIYQTVFQKDLDLWISEVSSESQPKWDGYRYQITLKSTEPVSVASSLQLIYEDGSQEVTSDLLMNRRTQKVVVNSSKRLEHLNLSTPQELGEVDQSNNHYNTNFWSRNLHVLESYSVPEYDSLIDQAGRIWIAVTGRVEENQLPSANLTVLDTDGSFLIRSKQVSPTGVYCEKPMLRQTTDGQVHMIWSSFIDDSDLLFHTSFTCFKGKISQGLTEKVGEEGISLSRPVFLQNNQKNNLILVQTAIPAKSGFALFHLNEAGHLVKVKNIANITAQDQMVEEVDPEELAKYGISMEEWLEYNTKEVDSDYFENRPFKDLLFLQDSEENYLIVWSEEYGRTTEVFFCKLDSNLNVIIPRKMILSPLTMFLDIDMTIKPQGDQLIFFWSEIDNAVHGQNQLSYAIFNEAGEQLKEKQVITGPYSWPIQHLTVDEDEKGNFNLVWSDLRLSSSIRPNRELVFQKMSSDLKILVPYYNLSQDLADQLRPQLKAVNGSKSLLWLNFKDKKYQLYFKSSNPEFVHALNDRLKWRDLIDSVVYCFELLFLSFGAQLFFIVSLNSFPVIGFMVTLILCTFFWMQDNWRNWIVILLALLSLKFATLGVFQKSALLVQKNCYLATTLIFLVVLLVFGGIQFLRKNSKFEHKLYLILAWMIIDSYVQTFLYYLAGLPK